MVSSFCKSIFRFASFTLPYLKNVVEQLGNFISDIVLASGCNSSHAMYDISNVWFLSLLTTSPFIRIRLYPCNRLRLPFRGTPGVRGIGYTLPPLDCGRNMNLRMNHCLRVMGAGG